MDINELTIGQAKELARMFPAEVGAPEEDKGVCIVVLQRSWVVVGHVYQTSTDIRVENAAVVRWYGTTKGLGELAKSGPLEKTKLDDCPPLDTIRSAVILSMRCNREKWNDRL